MTLAPIIERELRAHARLAFTYGLRVLGVAMLLVATGYFGLHNGFELNVGSGLFSCLNFTLFWAIWILVPLLTADCISREKREGTLGLLFLTPLRAGDVVVAKGFAHGLRAFTLWLAVLPVFTVPFLQGGVSWREAFLSVLTSFSCFCWALGAGMLASSIGKAWVRSLLLACILGVGFCLAYLFVNGCSLLLVMNSPSFSGNSLGNEVNLSLALQIGFVGATDFGENWPAMFMALPVRSHGTLIMGQMAVAGLSALVLMGAVGMAASRVSRTWQERPPSALQLWWQHTMCTPVAL